MGTPKLTAATLKRNSTRRTRHNWPWMPLNRSWEMVDTWFLVADVACINHDVQFELLRMLAFRFEQFFLGLARQL